MSKNKPNRSWWRGHFIDHPGFAEGGPGSFVESYTGNTKATKVYCAACLPVDIERIIQDDLHAINQGRITAVRDDAEIQTYLWSKPRTTNGPGGFTRYAVSTCLNHLKSCSAQPLEIQQRARAEAASPKKQRPSPYQTAWSGATLAPGMVPSGSGSSQMRPPSLPPSTRFNSPALHGYPMMPSPSIIALPSPLLPALPLPLIGTLPSSFGNHPSTQYSQSPMSTPQSLYAEPAASRALQLAWPSGGGAWSPELQTTFETRITRLTAAAGLPLSWVDNPEWIDFIHEFLPGAVSPSRRVLTSRLVPRAAENYRQIAKESSKDQNATIQADGWTGINFHHLLGFMITVNKKVYTVNVHDTSCERKTADNLVIHLNNTIDTVRGDYSAHVVGVVTDASGECRKARRLLALEHPDIVFLDCYAHQINLVVGDYFKSKAEALGFADEASDLITWLRSKTLILAHLRVVQAALPGTEGIKAVIRAVLTRWTMHYPAYRRLHDLQTSIIILVEADEKKADANARFVITGDTRAQKKATEMVKLIKNPEFWNALTVMERHLKPLAVAANITQAAHCRLDTVLLTFGFLVVQYRAMVKAEDLVGCAAILQSLEKRWLAADQDVFIATVIVNPLFQTTPFASGPRFIIARIKALLASLYMRFFQSEVPASFYTEVHEFLMGIKQYSELRATCVRHIHTSKHEGKDPDPLAVLQEFVVPGHPATPFYLLANRLLSICANSATCERLFSVFGTTLTKLRNRMGTSTLSSLAELKMHIRGEHQEKSTKTRMKNLFGHRSRTSPTDPAPAPQPPPPNPIPGRTVDLSTSLTPEMSTSGLRHLIPDDVEDSEQYYIAAHNPTTLSDLFDFNNDHWVNLYNEYAQNHLAEELTLCELLNQDAATDEGAEVDVDEMTGEILMG